MTASETRAAIDSVVRMEFARLVAGLARYTGDVGVAEELAQDALVAALEQWPKSGVPSNAGAWLMTVAKRRAIDLFRRNRALERKYAELGRDLAAVGEGVTPDVDRAGSDEIDDDVLRLVFTACHPVLSVPARVALTLRLLGGLSTAEIARAYLVPEPTIAQRIVRAKRTIAKAKVPFEVPTGRERTRRLGSVLEVIYLIFNEGYSATAGGDWMRPELCADALRLGRMLAQLAPDEPEVLGLVALMEIQSSRARARTGPSGEPILLLDQERTRWDRLLINRGLAALALAEELSSGVPGPYTLQGAIAACHARAFRAEDTDWTRIAGLYAALAEVAPSPVVELNRAVAVSMAFGAQAGLDVVDTLTEEPAMRSYHLLSSVRGDLLVKLQRPAEAHVAFERAATLTRNGRERGLMLERSLAAAHEAAQLDQSSDEGGVMFGAALVGFVGVSDLDRAQQFYGDTLGLVLSDERPFALVADVGGTMLRITAVGEVTAAPYTVLGWRVPDLASMIDGLVARGVSFTRYEGMDQDERGVWTAPGGSRVAWFLDPDGNNLSLTQPSAAG